MTRPVFRALLVSAFLTIGLPRLVGAAPEVPPLTTSGPGGSAFTLSAGNRLRGEFADWFDAGGAASNSDYSYLGNRTQIGFLAKWRGFSGFLQYQHTVLNDVPQHAANAPRRHPDVG